MDKIEVAKIRLSNFIKVMNSWEKNVIGLKRKILQKQSN